MSEKSSKIVDIDVYTVRKMREIFHRLLNYRHAEKTYEEISKLEAIESYCFYKVSFNLSDDRENFPIYVYSCLCFVNGRIDADHIGEFKTGQLIDKEHVISKCVFNISKMGKSDSYVDVYERRGNTCFFYLGDKVFRVIFQEDYFKNSESQIYILLDIIRRATLSYVLQTTFTEQISLSFKDIIKKKTKVSKISTGDIKFEDIIRTNARILHTTYGFDKIIFENSSKNAILFNQTRGYVFDIRNRKDTDEEIDVERKILNENEEIKGFNTEKPIEVGRNKITIHMSSPNYSKFYVDNILKLDNFLLNLKIIFQNFFFYNSDMRRFIEREKKLRRTSELDDLTKLLNRKGFYRLTKEKSGKDDEIVLIEIDIDDFKKINDTYGHDAGDGVLQHISSLMSEIFTRNSLLSRFGGEEFCILIPKKTMIEGLFYIESFRDKVEKTPYIYKSIGEEKNIDSKKINYTISSGITVFILPKDDKGIEICLQKQLKYVDKALYRAKRNGKNCIFQYVNGEIKRYYKESEQANRPNFKGIT